MKSPRAMNIIDFVKGKSLTYDLLMEGTPISSLSDRVSARRRI